MAFKGGQGLNGIHVISVHSVDTPLCTHYPVHYPLTLLTLAIVCVLVVKRWKVCLSIAAVHICESDVVKQKRVPMQTKGGSQAQWLGGGARDTCTAPQETTLQQLPQARST